MLNDTINCTGKKHMHDKSINSIICLILQRGPKLEFCYYKEH